MFLFVFHPGIWLRFCIKTNTFLSVSLVLRTKTVVWNVTLSIWSNASVLYLKNVPPINIGAGLVRQRYTTSSLSFLIELFYVKQGKDRYSQKSDKNKQRRYMEKKEIGKIRQDVKKINGNVDNGFKLIFRLYSSKTSSERWLFWGDKQ